MSASEIFHAGARRGPVLLDIARDAIARPDDELQRHEAEWLRHPAATFVTLKIDDELRGCIGTLEPRRSLAEDVAGNARSAAYHDPRFPPVRRDEIPLLQVEVSLLSPQEPFEVRDEAEAIALLRPGVDGVCFTFGIYRSTFLPQVWESIPDAAAFLGELKRKAGLSSRFWHPEVRLSRYTVEKFR